MTRPVLTAVAAALVTFAAAPLASAQNAVLAEYYGQGVHAYYSGDMTEAWDMLTMAIDNGSKDPRAYYFRGMVAHETGRQEQADSDWKQGAELEASGNASAAIGRSLERFQGTARLQLESIRAKARLKAMAEAAAKSKARYGEVQQAQARVLRRPPQPAATAATPPAATTPPPAAAAPAADDPFADDSASGQAKVESNDALEGAMENPFAGQPAIPAGQVPPNDASDPFGGGAAGGADPFGAGGAGGADPFGAGAGGASAGGADPFGAGGADAGAGGADPFGAGGADAGAGGADPFGAGGADAGAGGADPFGAGGADAGAGDDPFGGNPFGN